METMAQYVIRRAREEKRYRRVVKDMGWEPGTVEWMRKLALDQIKNPGSDRIEALYRHYKLLEATSKRKNGHRKEAA